MKLSWKGRWKNGEISVEVDSVEELVNILKELEPTEPFVPQETDTPRTSIVKRPQVSGKLGPSDAIREILNSPWGKKEPRTMSEIMEVMGANALYFSKSTVSGVLTNLTKSGELRRPMKKAGKWAYVLSG